MQLPRLLRAGPKYTYILIYVNGIIILYKAPFNFMSMLMDKNHVKTSSIGDPKLYLGKYTGKVDYIDVSYAWTMSSDYYVKEAIKDVNIRMKDDNM